jgi:hypothetical protein
MAPDEGGQDGGRGTASRTAGHGGVLARQARDHAVDFLININVEITVDFLISRNIS